VIYTAAVDFTLNMLVEGFGPETRGILLLPPRWVIIIFISTDVLSGKFLLLPVRVADEVVLVQTVGAGLVGASTSAFFEDEAVAVSYEQAGNIMIAGLALQVSSTLAQLGIGLYLDLRLGRLHFIPHRRHDSGLSIPKPKFETIRSNAMDALGHPIQCAHVDLASSIQMRRIRYWSVNPYLLIAYIIY
jgi:hypothetical protein